MNVFLLAGLASSLLLAGCTNTGTLSEPQDAKIESSEETTVRAFPEDSFHELLVAEFAVRRQHYDTALQNYLQQAAKTRDPGVSARATRLAKYLKAEKVTFEAAKLWLQLEPDNLEANFTVATQLAKLQKPLEALPHMEAVLQRGGKVNFALIAAASANQPTEIQQQVSAKIDKLLEQHPHNDQLLTAKAMLLQQQGDDQQALVAIQAALNENDDNLHAVLVEARLLQRLGREDEAFDRIEQVLQDNPNNRRLRLQYARMLMTQDITEAKQQFEQLLTSTPKDGDLLLTLALISKENGELTDSKNYFTQLLNSGNHTAQAHFNLGQLAEQEEQWDNAVQHYQQVPYGNLFLKAVNRSIHIQHQQQQLIAARSYLATLRQQYPEVAVRLVMLESELLMSGEYFQAGFDLLSETLLQHPGTDTLLYARSMFSDKLGNLDMTEQDLRAMLVNNPDNPLALNALGYSLTNHSKRYEEARQLISKALTLKPNDPAIMDSLGWVEFKLGRIVRALELLTKAYQLFPDHEVAAHLGEVLWHAGKQSEAQAIWQQGLEQHPDSPLIEETLQRLLGAAQ
jgi:tetratricopeptide (TPR) repeat protein